MLQQGGKLVQQAPELVPGAAARVVDTLLAEGRFHFAVRACAQTLTQGTKDDASAALGRLLAPPLLLPDGLATLSRVLQPLVAKKG